MPELPEVETSRRGIAPHIAGGNIEIIIVRDSRLRWPVPRKLPTIAQGQHLHHVGRRGKYILLQLDTGHILIHLGMSGSLRICPPDRPPQKHDHVDICLDNGNCLRLRDPRRFGCVLWQQGEVDRHPLLKDLGPEPLGEDFDTDYLYDVSRGRRCSIKSLIMDSHVVVGVGNIYACEALFRAGINPKRMAGKISRQRVGRLVSTIRETLQQAISQGGTTLRDFSDEGGKPGYFKQALNVYGRAGEQCRQCDNIISRTRQQQRSTFYCKTCQR